MSWFFGRSKRTDSEEDSYGEYSSDEEYSHEEDDGDDHSSAESFAHESDQDSGVLVQPPAGEKGSAEEAASAESSTDDQAEEDASSNHAVGEKTLQLEQPPVTTKASRPSSRRVSENTNNLSEDEDIDEAVEEQVLAGILPGSIETLKRNRVRVQSDLSLCDKDEIDKANDMTSRHKSSNEDESGYDDDEEEESSREEDGAQVDHVKSSRHAVVEEGEEAPTTEISHPEDANDDDDDDDDDEEEEVTSPAERHALLVLAAEHDRVDILQAILTGDEMQEDDRQELLHSEKTIPPLHIAVSYGSVSATTSLLRMGADPSLRPDVQAIEAAAAANTESSSSAPVDIPNRQRFDGVSAWELAFGTENAEENDSDRKSWFFSSSKSNLEDEESSQKDKSSSAMPTKKRSVKPVHMAPSKREGIRHAFTAEALRSIGADESDRLKQLLDSGMPPSTDIGGKSLYDWSIEMGAPQCEALLKSKTVSQNKGDGNGAVSDDKQVTDSKSDEPHDHRTAVLDRPSDESLTHLANRLDELESLAKALSTCLDNLAEEVSVSHGLLLMGGGASALASHVRSLKATKDRKYDELTRLEEAWENSEDELAYWVDQAGEEGQRIAEEMTPLITDQPVLSRRASIASAATPEEEEANRRQLKAQIENSEHKIRKLRVAIADLSEENTRNLEAVEQRGLSGGINLVRGLREEIREIDFELAEFKSAEATCRTKISLIQSSLYTVKKPASSNGNHEAIATTDVADSTAEISEQDDAPTSSDPTSNGIEHTTMDVPLLPEEEAVNSEPMVVPEEMTASERVAAGESMALTVRDAHADSRGLLSLWQILLRIMGVRHGGQQTPAVTRQSSESSASNRYPAMIV